MGVKNEFMWATLVHLGTNLWFEEGNEHGMDEDKLWKFPASKDLRFDRTVWENYILRMKECGVNTIVLDVADALKYDSHPEIAVNGAWTPDEMRAEIKRLNDMGFEVIPKLNFSSCHDEWLGVYSRMLSTPIYYQVCKDLIDEVCEIFKPRFVHLGMDEEVFENQKDYDFIVIRQHDLWWHDFYYLVQCVENNGARAMMFSDHARHYPEEFVEKVPKSVVQCVWYYFNKFGDDMDEMCEVRVRPLKTLDEAGYDIFPTGSIEYFDENLLNLTKYCAENISKEHLLGFMQTTWESVTPERTDYLERGNVALKAAKDWYNQQK